MEKHHKYKGLTSEQVRINREKYGANVLTPPKRDPWWKLYLEKFNDPLIRILVIAAIIAVFAGIAEGKYYEGLGIIIAILLATGISFFNEYKANKEFDILNKVNDEVPVKVIRDGNYTTIPKKDIVVEDIIILEAGEEVPADGEVLEAISFQVDESRLTGESVPVTKVDKFGPQPQKETTYPPYKVLSGSLVSDGHAVIEVTAVGDNTEIGKTARAAAEETNEQTPLNKQLEKLSKVIGVFGFSIAALIYFTLVIHGAIIGKENGGFSLTFAEWYFTGVLTLSVIIALSKVWLPIVYDALELLGKEVELPEWLEDTSFKSWAKTLLIALIVFGIGLGIGIFSNLLSSNPSTWLPGEVGSKFLVYFMISITIIVVAVPEGLPMSVTLSLAYSMRKMMASNNLVRRMHACETIGAATVICTDKTGTLTMNEMRVYEMISPVISDNKLDLNDKNSKLIAEAISGNSTANLTKINNETKPIGNPTEGALLLFLDQNQIDYLDYRENFKIISQLTFSTERKYMATLGESQVLNKPVLYAKGAPEILLDKCGYILTKEGIKQITDQDKESIKDNLKNYQARGMRTLGFSYLEEIPNVNTPIEELAQNMIWLGFVAIADPVRPEVPEAIKKCQEAGIKVKIVTGDNPYTAKEIAKQITLWNEEDDAIPSRHIQGPEFANLSEEEAVNVVKELKIISRAKPMDKLKLVKSLQKNNEVVAVTGDGTNDAPALNHANVGLAMGKTGTSVAKEASDIILLDDSFTSIVNGVMWGRSLYQNIQRFIIFQLTINVSALLIAFLGPFLGIELPFTVIQMLWVNLIMDTFAALALATEPPHWEVMKKPPRDPKAFILTPDMTKFILGVGFSFVIVFIALLLYLKNGGLTRYEETVFYSTYVFAQIWNLFNARAFGLQGSAFKGLLENKWFVIIFAIIFIGQIFIVQIGGDVFRTTPLKLIDWIYIILGTSVILWIGEIIRLTKSWAKKY